MSLKWLTKSLCNHEPKNITLLQHLEVPPCSPLQPPQTTTSWHPHQHALSSSSCPPASPSNLTDCNSWAGTDRRCRCETLRNSDREARRYKQHKTTTQTDLTEITNSSQRDTDQNWLDQSRVIWLKKKVMTWWLWTILQQPKSKIYTQSLVLDLFGQNVTIFLSTFVFYLLCTPTANDGFSYLQPHNTSFNFIRAFSEQTFP